MPCWIYISFRESNLKTNYLKIVVIMRCGIMVSFASHTQSVCIKYSLIIVSNQTYFYYLFSPIYPKLLQPSHYNVKTYFLYHCCILRGVWESLSARLCQSQRYDSFFLKSEARWEEGYCGREQIGNNICFVWADCAYLTILIQSVFFCLFDNCKSIKCRIPKNLTAVKFFSSKL